MSARCIGDSDIRNYEIQLALSSQIVIEHVFVDIHRKKVLQEKYLQNKQEETIFLLSAKADFQNDFYLSSIIQIQTRQIR